MGFRFRKSFKIAPGIKFNVNKKSVGLTVGKRGAHFTVNSKGKRTTSVGIPGTGLSYTTSSGGKKSKRKSTAKQQPVAKTTANTAKAVNTVNNENKKSFKSVPLILGIVFVVIGLSATNILMLALGAILLYKYWKDKQVQPQITTKDAITSSESSVLPSTSKNNINSEYISDELNVPTYCRQIEESIELIENSKNPDTVISRFNFLQTVYSKLLNVSGSVLDWYNLNERVQKILQNKESLINASIKRALDDELLKINQLKTEKGKINRLHRFFEKMRTIPDLPSENMPYIDKLEQETQI